MKLDIKEFKGKVRPIRDTDVYSVHDLEYLENLNVSMTILHPGKSTAGHEHEGIDEVYVVMDGRGELQLDEKRFPIDTGDIILIKGGQFHQTFNTSSEDLVFVCIFEKYEGRGGSKPVKYAGQRGKPGADIEKLKRDLIETIERDTS
jgi:mannose-6-phosphate isomerase-like protein (cupin superfamily)